MTLRTRRLRAAAFAALAVLGAALLPGAATAQDMPSIRQYLHSIHPGCSLTRARIAYRGALAGAAGRPVTVVLYTYEGCGGGRDWQAPFIVLYREQGAIRSYRMEPAPAADPDGRDDVVQRVRVVRNRLEVSALGYAPNDPHCCPTLRRRAVYVLRGGVLLRVDPGPARRPDGLRASRCP